MVFIVFVLFFALGLALFSLASGFILYFTTLTTNHAELESDNITKAERASVVHAHTKDARIMLPLNVAKERWFKKLDSGLITECVIRSQDGLALYGYYAPNPQASGKIALLVHGMLDSAAGMAYLYEEYYSRGWSVFLVDQRSHGKSEGTKRTMGVRESEDIGLWVEYINRELGGTHIILHGLSMGGATVLLYGARKKGISPSVKGIISDSCFARYDRVFSHLVLSFVKIPFVAACVVRGTSVASFLCSGVLFSRMNPSKNAGKIPVPVLLFHGDGDLLVPVSTAQELFSAVLKPACMKVVIPQAPHIGPYFYAPELYMKKVEEFSGRLIQ